MKKLSTTFFLMACLTITGLQLSAQDANGFVYRFNFVNYVTPRNDYGLSLSDKNWNDNFQAVDYRAMEFAYMRFLKDEKTSVVVPFKLGIAKIPDRKYQDATRDAFLSLDGLVQHYMFKQNRFIFNPYFHYGLGAFYNWSADYWNINLPVGLGLNMRLAENIFITGQTQYRLSSVKHPGWHHGIGIQVNFGGAEKKPVVTDRDGDGVIDINDVCPDEAGVAALNGCPDRDKDGVADKDDKCPDVLGVVALMGCPDRDGDGIADSDDLCPEQKGIAAFNGCPDTDGDGVQDKDDTCPREKGLVSLKGCPDTDGDGIADKDDACPKEKGTVAAKGCPDRDGDGITDKDDKCPDKKGDAAHKGCPDTDGDGIYDNDDRCVDKPGPASNKGCPELKKEDKAKLLNVIKNVQFETGKATLLTKSYAVLDEVVALMNQYPEYSLTISGHTDNVGDAAKNQTLSEQRAKACFDYIVSKNISADRMTHAGYGATKPVADNKTKAGRDTNRRVDFDLFVK